MEKEFSERSYLGIHLYLLWRFSSSTIKLDNGGSLSSSSAHSVKSPTKKQECSLWLILLLPVYIGESAVTLWDEGGWHWQEAQDSSIHRGQIQVNELSVYYAQ